MDHQKLNWLRAGVLGANDGIISIATLLIALTGNISSKDLFIVALSATIAGALSMSIGEYVSVSAQKDAELANQRTEITNPFHAAYSSFLAFITGAILPVATATLTQNIWVTLSSVIAALLLTGYLSAKAGNLPAQKPMLRNVIAGTIALTIGIAANLLFGTAI